MLTSDELRAFVRQGLRDLDRTYWDVGDALAELQGSRTYRVLWGFRTFGDFVETEYGLPRAKARRLIAVVRHFTPFRKELEGVGWSTLSAAIPLVKRMGPAEAIHVAKAGYTAVLQRKQRVEEPGLKTFSIRLTCELHEQMEYLLELAARVAEYNGATIDPDSRMNAFAAILAEAQSGLEGQLPPEARCATSA